MKRVCSIFLAFILSFCSVIYCFSAVRNHTSDQIIEYYADGSYAIIFIENVQGVDQSKGNITKSKSYSYYNSSNVLQWTVKLTASFTYNGSTATCTSASTGHTIYDTSWQVTKAVASKSGNTATGDFTVKKYTLGIVTQTVNKTLTLTCSPSGVVT